MNGMTPHDLQDINGQWAALKRQGNGQRFSMMHASNPKPKPEAV